MGDIRYIDPLKDLGSLLLTVEKPARYTGGEYGRLCTRGNSILNTIIAFPDLYEIGMSNQALRILYNALNLIEGISCDRAFAPAPDFEELLSNSALPLYGLDTGISLKDSDLLMFTLGYELSFTGVLSMLNVSGIPLHSQNRADNDPLVIMGGPCVSNPHPYSDFIDAFWIGEAEGGFFELAVDLKEIKQHGGGRQALFERLQSHPSMWTKGKGRAVRAVDSGFDQGKAYSAVFPVPSMKVVHHHGAVEIMRGCPNGCRFCHAGYWYRPMRQKSAALIAAETETFIHSGGYREITLSSLSSGDYQYLDGLIDSLNQKYKNEHISFQLPSLKVSTFSLNLLEKISEVRKSGLTFAVETPLDYWQLVINKMVSSQDIVSILREARRRGWKGAKFYFMVGLPVEHSSDESVNKADSNRNDSVKHEEEEIAAFVEYIAKQTGMHFNINIGTFVPKPHTPFQWSFQISREEADKKLFYLRSRLKAQGHKVGIQDPLISVIEGLVSRGDERVGAFFEEAFHNGCRLDAWNEYFKREIWESILAKNNHFIDEILSQKKTSNPLPWSEIDLGMYNNFFISELNRSQAGEVTSPCIKNCNSECSICTKSLKLVQNTMQDAPNNNSATEQQLSKPLPQIKTIDTAPIYDSNNDSKPSVTPERNSIPDLDTYRILFSFSKQGSAVFHPHLGLLEIFSMAFIRANIPVKFTQGFNPLPKLDIASPLSLGITAKEEIASIDTKVHFDADSFISLMNVYLPDGFLIHKAVNVLIKAGEKKHSVSALLWGFVYAGKDGTPINVIFKDEKTFRNSMIENGKNLYSLERIGLLAKESVLSGNIENTQGISYFDLYRKLYPDYIENKPQSTRS